LEDAEREKAK
jgi:membrane protein involved in colicin uptake